jgi:hypothetical protein
MNASPETLMRQAGTTANEWLHQGIESIDRAFGEGYAEKNPELLSAFMKAAAQDQHTAYFARLVSVKENEACDTVEYS